MTLNDITRPEDYFGSPSECYHHSATPIQLGLIVTPKIDFIAHHVICCATLVIAFIVLNGPSRAIALSRTVESTIPSRQSFGSQEEQKEPVSPLLKYATDDFFAGAYLNVQSLLEKPNESNFPIDVVLPHTLLTERLRGSSIAELVMLLQQTSPKENASRDEPGRLQKIQLAAAIRTEQPLVLEQVLTLASRINFRDHSNGLVGTSEVAGRTCYQLRSGTLLNPQHKRGELHFEDADGSVRSSGRDIGSIAPHRYIQAEEDEKAVFTFAKITQTDLVDGNLILSLNPAVFLVKQPDGKDLPTQIYLRRPGGTLISQPIEFAARTLSESRIEIPSALSAIDRTGEPRTVDLLQDLVVDGELEVAIGCKEKGTYIGFKPNGVGIESRKHEYLVIDDHYLIIAQSKSTLEKMLRSKKAGSLGQKLNREDLEIFVAAELGAPSQRDAFREFLDLTSLGVVSRFLPDDSASLMGSFDADPATAALQLSVSDPNVAADMSSRLQQALAAAKSETTGQVLEAAQRLHGMDQILNMVFTEIRIGFPSLTADIQEFLPKLERGVGEFFDDFFVDQKENEVTIQFQPVLTLHRSPLEKQLILSTLELIQGRSLIEQKEFVLGDRMYQRSAERLGNNISAWTRRAHQLSFNNYGEFQHTPTQYKWFRRGIISLLEGSQLNPDSCELTWTAANFLSFKLCRADEREQLLELFAEDNELHEILRPYVNLDESRSSKGDVDGMQITKQLFEYCQDQYELGKTSHLEEYELYARVIHAQSQYARSLDERGQFERANQEWAKATLAYFEMGERSISVSGTIQLNAIGNDLALPGFDQDESEQESIGQKIARLKQRFESWIWRTEFEQTESTRKLRRLEFEASKLLAQERQKESLAKYQSALRVVSQLIEDEPNREISIIKASYDLCAGYKNLVEELGATVDGSLSDLMDLFDELDTADPFFGMSSFR